MDLFAPPVRTPPASASLLQQLAWDISQQGGVLPPALAQALRGPQGPAGPAGPAGSGSVSLAYAPGLATGVLAVTSGTTVSVTASPTAMNGTLICALELATGVSARAGNNPTLKAATALNLTADVTTSGAGGLDTGTATASNWYNFFLIGKADGTLALIFSLGSGGGPSLPAMPTGYLYALFLGAAYYNASAAFNSITQFGNRVWCPAQVVFTSHAASQANTYASVDISTFVPPSACVVYGSQGNSLSGNGTGMAVAADSSGTGEQIMFVNVVTSTTALDSFFMAGNFQCPITSGPPAISWKASTTSAANRLVITGWEYPRTN